MICPQEHCDGTLYRFQPGNLVEARYEAPTGVTLVAHENDWRQIGLMCGTCGYMEFFTQNPQEVLNEWPDFFESTEPTEQ